MVVYVWYGRKFQLTLKWAIVINLVGVQVSLRLLEHIFNDIFYVILNLNNYNYYQKTKLH